MADTEALQAELNELYAVRTKLLTGSSKEQVQFGDRRVTYSAVNIEQVNARIRTLESQLGINKSRQRRAIGIAH